MCGVFEVEITPQAQEQVQAIGWHVANSLCAPMAANRLVDKLEAAILSLSSNPERIPLTHEEPWHSRGIHKMVTGKYIIYFLILDEINTVRVMAVVYGRRDQKKQLKEMGIE